MKRDIIYYKQLEKLNYYVYHKKQYEKPKGWYCVDSYEDKKTGFYAEAFINDNDEVFMVIRGTEVSSIKDLAADVSTMFESRMTMQVEPAYKFYEKLSKKYDKISVSGYSLGASVATILGNDMGLETVNFAPLAVGKFIEKDKDENIINFGNIEDPFFRQNFDYHIGDLYVIGIDNDSSYKYLNSEEFLDISKHMPNNIGNLEMSHKMTKNLGQKFNLYASYDKLSDDIFTPQNRIFHKLEMNVKDMDEATLKQYVNQYYDDDSKFPSKSELDRRVRFGELIHVQDYVRSDGTKVSGYYRRYPNK